MGIYDRDYVRNDDSGSAGLFALMPVTKYLVLANIVVYILQLIIVRDPRPPQRDMMRDLAPAMEKIAQQQQNGEPVDEAEQQRQIERLVRDHEREFGNVARSAAQPSVVQGWFELDTNDVLKKGQIWRLITHAFCHSRYDFWHIVFNMVALYVFGGALEMLYGSREFLLFYLTGVVAAALAFIALDLFTGSRVPAVGASGGVMAVMMLYTCNYPRTIIYMFWVIPVEMRLVMVFYVLYDLHPIVLALSGERLSTGVAHAAHLGGLAFGFCYAKFRLNLGSIIDELSDRRRWPLWLRRSPLRSRPNLRIAPESAPDDEPDVDDILRKIFISGKDSLTDDERETLRRASARLKGRRE